jgi:hypothetical protein
MMEDVSVTWSPSFPDPWDDRRCAALPTGSSTVLFELLAVLYGLIGRCVLTSVRVKDSSTEQYSSTAARANY